MAFPGEWFTKYIFHILYDCMLCLFKLKQYLSPTIRFFSFFFSTVEVLDVDADDDDNDDDDERAALHPT